MNKKDNTTPLEKIKILEDELSKLKYQISLKKSYTLNDLVSYAKACEILEESKKENPSSYDKIKTIVKAANFIDNNNKIWKANWKDFQEYKYAPYKYFSGGSWSVSSDGWNSYRFYFGGYYYKNKSTCDKMVNKFIDIYEDFWEN